MHWIWWVLIIFVALFIVNKLSEDRPGFRHILCSIIGVVYPIVFLIDQDKFGWLLFVGPLAIGFYKYVYGLAEMLENDGAGDIIGTLFVTFTDGEVTVVSIIVSVIVSALFAAVAIIPVAFFTDFSLILAGIWLFVTAVYCIFCAVRYFKEA